MRVLFAGGGTGGHINPAISIADYIKSKEDNYIVKIMCWDSMTKLIPLDNCEVATVQQ